MATVWEEFGLAVRKARTAKGRNWTGEQLAHAAFGNAERKSYISQIERGGTRLSARTVQKLAQVLDLPDAVTDPVLRAHLPVEDKLDTDARRLMQMAADDSTAPGTADALMIALAYEFAAGSHINLSTAYTGLRNALQAAQEMKDQLDRLHNMDDRLTAVLRRVADLNDRGLRDAAGEALEAAIKAKEAELEALHDAALKQDRLRNDPAAAAKRLVARLKASAPPGGVFKATHDLLNEMRRRGDVANDTFDLAVALSLAKANLERAKGPQRSNALNALGNCHLAIGERQLGDGNLIRARDAFAQALEKTPRQRDEENWAIYSGSLGNALLTIGKRVRHLGLLRESIAAIRASLSFETAEKTPAAWADSQNNLGIALQTLGEHLADPDLLRQAIEALHAALNVRSINRHPMAWAASQNNLGLALRWLGTVTRDATRFDEAATAFATV